MIESGQLSTIPLFAGIAPPLLAHLAARAADIAVKPGEWIVNDGDPAYFWILLAGDVETVKRVAGKLHQITTFEPGEFFGEVPLMLGANAFAGVRALTACRLARVDPLDFHRMIGESSSAAAMLAQTLVRRTGFLRDAYAASTIAQATIVGHRFDFACHDLRDFLARNQIAFDWLDPGEPSETACIPAAVLAAQRYPVVILADGGIIESPSLRELARHLNLQTEPKQSQYDVVIVGSGPAGLAAGVYGGSEGLRTLLIDREAPGGQAGTSSRIENYLGFPSGISGSDLADRALLQAKRFGTEIVITRNVTAIVPKDDGQLVRFDDGIEVQSRAVVIATGVRWRRLDNVDAERLVGRGVYYGAARTEALGTLDKEIFLIGGGNSAGQAAMFFSAYARRITLLVRGPSLQASMSYYLIEQLRTKDNIAVETQTVVAGVSGDAHLETITTHDLSTGISIERKADALFAFIGADAQTDWLPAEIERDAHCFIRTGHDIERWPLTRAPYPLETSVPGIFAAGDVRSESVKRVASGVGEGSIVISFVHQHLAAPALLK